MPPHSKPAATTYKKKDGSLTISDDKKNVYWTTTGSSSPTVNIRVSEITNLQQTPATSKSIALKIFVGDESHVFTFKERGEQERITDVLREQLAVNKAKDGPQLAPAAAPAEGNGQGQSAAMAIAKAVASKAADEGWYDDNKLKGDTQLQRSLLDSNQALRERFNQALKDKPESVSISQFTSQFWSARLHLLRAHAIENAQKQGEYNVLPEIRYVRKVAEKPDEEDVLMLNITKEQIKLLFKQYPIVREAYNANVPPMQPNDFWTRFFKSRLLKKLKGERISQHDERDNVLDKYLDRPEGGAAYPTPHIPHWMDLEGNEQNHSQRMGNRPDEDMRPSGHDKAPILRVLNNLSEKMMAHIAPEDSEAHAPIGMDEGTFEQLRLRDLANDDVDNRVILNVREQQRYAGGSQDDLSKEAKLYAKQDPNKVLSSLRSQLQPSELGADEHGTLRLDQAICYQTDSDSDDDENEAPSHQANGTAPKKKLKVGSHAAISHASTDIMQSIRQRRHAQSSDPNSLNGLSQATFDTLTMTHNTTTEFLHYFWTLFLSGDASKSNELAQLVSTLDRSLDRINAVAAQAEAERQKIIDARKAEDKAYFDKTKKRRKTNYEAFPGGRRAVEGMVRPTVQALDRATTEYRRAFEEQSKEAGVAGAAVAVG